MAVARIFSVGDGERGGKSSEILRETNNLTKNAVFL